MDAGNARFFIALIPPAPLAQQAQALKEYCSQRYNSHAALRSPPHITLHMPFGWKEKNISRLTESLSSFAGNHKRFEVCLNGFACFAPRVIYIHVESSEALMSFEQSLLIHCRHSLNLLNSHYRDLPFHPHLTIAFRDLKKAAFQEAWLEFSQKQFAATFTATQFCLLRHDGQRWHPYQNFALAQW